MSSLLRQAAGGGGAARASLACSRGAATSRNLRELALPGSNSRHFLAATIALRARSGARCTTARAAAWQTPVMHEMHEIYEHQTTWHACC